jgi:hypothetical protein
VAKVLGERFFLRLDFLDEGGGAAGARGALEASLITVGRESSLMKASHSSTERLSSLSLLLETETLRNKIETELQYKDKTNTGERTKKVFEGTHTWGSSIKALSSGSQPTRRLSQGTFVTLPVFIHCMKQRKEKERKKERKKVG